MPSVAEAYYGHHPDGCNCAAHSDTMTLSHRIAKTIDKVIELAEMRSLSVGGRAKSKPVEMNRTSKTRNAIADIYNTDKKALNKDIFDIYHKDYNKALDSVFSDIDSNHQLWENVQKFRLNAANFAAHKTYQLQQKLLEIKKEAANEKDFVNKAKPISTRFNQYQKTEYNTFVARSRTAKQWDTFQQEKHLFQNLTWIRSRSANPRELHLGYEGITLPINDPFWQTNQPGNLWNCKCDWKTTDAQPTAEPTKIIPPMAGLEGNPYYTGKIITDNHPYFKDAPDRVRKFAILSADENLVWNETKIGKGKLITHTLAEEEDEFKENIIIATRLIKEGYSEIKLLPQIHADEPQLKIKYYGAEYYNKFGNKNCDAFINNEFYEFKTSSFGNLSTRIKAASKQADIIVLKPESLITENYMKWFIERQFAWKDRLNVKTIIIINKDDKIHTFNRINKGEPI